jgi:hypothetical protein
MWLGHIQHIDETVSEICLDLDVDDVWYTVWVRMPRSDVKEFVAALEQILPGELLFKRTRYHPNIRYHLIKSHRIDVKNPDRRRIDEPNELYLTPLYLVVLTHTFVSRAIPIDSIASFKMEAIADSSNDYRILQLITENRTENFVIEHNLDFESRLQQLIH